MPPHLPYFLQPLNVVVFQPLKHYHAKALDTMVRESAVIISKLKLLSCIRAYENKPSKKQLNHQRSNEPEFPPFAPSQ